MTRAGVAALALALVPALAACRRGAPPPAPTPPPAPAPGARADASDEPRQALVAPRRCGECHDAIERQWRASAHARARTPLYGALRAKAPSAATCDACHAPLVAVAPGDPVADEAVSCDVCHTLRDVAPRREGPRLALHLDDNVKYGPLCDAKDHYFHRMGCSPLHHRATLCGACHTFWLGGLPVHNELEEWQAGPAAADGIACQSCHMPGSSTPVEVATGAGVRPRVPHHGLLGRSGDLRRRALELHVAVTRDGDAIDVAATVENRGAGHPVPTGLPERRVILRVRALDRAGVEQARDERRYGRELVDGAGDLAAFPLAVRQASDTRVAPGEVRREVLKLAAPRAGRVRAELVWRPVDERIAAQLAVDAPPDEVLATVETPFGPPRGGRRVQP